MGVDAASLRRAFDRGVNYWYHGSWRGAGMTTAVRELVAAGRRDDLVLVLQSYARFAWPVERSVVRGLRQLGLDHADVLLLGMYGKAPRTAILERAERLREKGMFRQLAISGHRRPAFVGFAADPRYAILHIRYNAAHPGAESDVLPHLSATDKPGLVAYTATSWRQLLDPRRMPPGERPLRPRDCYRFVLSNPAFEVCMTGPKNAAEMDEALTALEAGPLTPEEDARIRRIGLHVSGKAVQASP